MCQHIVDVHDASMLQGPRFARHFKAISETDCNNKFIAMVHDKLVVMHVLAPWFLLLSEANLRTVNKFYYYFAMRSWIFSHRLMRLIYVNPKSVVVIFINKSLFQLLGVFQQPETEDSTRYLFAQHSYDSQRYYLFFHVYIVWLFEMFFFHSYFTR